ncbi:hypothetical protein PHMEG_00016223 [Phytophthora megakarya]|uniref:Uncharacterized protein n=1 Tax=Phytophthora megakarya TaxID=4795 RepID=A0A225W0W6_9STRA|nr:hypothetical protein PHMEG_00016223 [Phytophthora megakarya]
MIGPWDNNTRIILLRMRLSSALKDSCTQLPSETRSNWKALAQLSRKGGVVQMKMQDQDTARMFLYRFNKAAKSAGIRFDATVSQREAHNIIRRFIRALNDNHLETTLQGQAFENIVELEKTLKRIESLRRKENQSVQQKIQIKTYSSGTLSRRNDEHKEEGIS